MAGKRKARTKKRVTPKKKTPAKKVGVTSFEKIQALHKKKKRTKAELANALTLINAERKKFRAVTPKKKQRKKDLDKIESELQHELNMNKKQFGVQWVKKPKADIFKTVFKRGNKSVEQIENTLKVLNLKKIDKGYNYIKMTMIFREGKNTSALTYVKPFTSMEALRRKMLKMFNDIKHGAKSNKKYMQRVNKYINYLTDIIFDYETVS